MTTNPDKDLGLTELFSMSDANLFSHGGAGGGGNGGAIVEEGIQTKNNLYGDKTLLKRALERELYGNIDVLSARRRPVPYWTTTDFVMDAKQAAQVTDALIRNTGLSKESDGVQKAFVDAMLLCLAKNSSSQQQPGRAEFVVETTRFNLFSDVIEVLGADARRYFRAYADITRDILLSLQAKIKAGLTDDSEESVQTYLFLQRDWNDVMRVANERGLARVPHLIHDSAEACTGLTVQERAFLAASKRSVIATITSNYLDNPVLARNKGGGAAKLLGAKIASSDEQVPDYM